MNARQIAPEHVTRNRRDAMTALTDFSRQIELNVHLPSDGFWKCEEPFLELAKKGFLTDFINQELTKVKDDSFYVPPMSSGAEIIIAQSDKYRLSVAIVNQRTAPVVDRLESRVSHYMLFIVGNEELPIATYEQPAPEPNDDLRRDARLCAHKPTTYRPGDLLRIRAARDVIEFRPLPGRNAVVLAFSSAPVYDYRWVYEHDSLLPIRLFPGEVGLTRIEYALQVTAHMGDRESLPTLRALASHSAHFIRWTAIRCAAQVDLKTGLELLEHARTDSHPQVRAAAETTLRRYSESRAVTD
jgi:hypothetical protein